MSDIGPGDFVERLFPAHEPPIPVGPVFRIRRLARVGTCECGLEAPGLIVDEAEIPDDGAWCPCGWKPVYRPKPDAFTDLLKAPDRVEEVA